MMQSPLQQCVRSIVRVWMEHWPGGAKVMETSHGQTSLPHVTGKAASIKAMKAPSEMFFIHQDV